MTITLYWRLDVADFPVIHLPQCCIMRDGWALSVSTRAAGQISCAHNLLTEGAKSSRGLVSQCPVNHLVKW